MLINGIGVKKGNETVVSYETRTDTPLSGNSKNVTMSRFFFDDNLYKSWLCVNINTSLHFRFEDASKTTLTALDEIRFTFNYSLSTVWFLHWIAVSDWRNTFSSHVRWGILFLEDRTCMLHSDLTRYLLIISKKKPIIYQHIWGDDIWSFC